MASATGPEGRITTSILAMLNEVGHARKVHPDQFTGKGQPDIDACVDGACIKIEVKAPGNEPTRLQYKRLRDWQESGAIAFWTTSVEHARAELAERGVRLPAPKVRGRRRSG